MAVALAAIWTAAAGPWPALFPLLLVAFFLWFLDHDGDASSRGWPDDIAGRFPFSA